MKNKIQKLKLEMSLANNTQDDLSHKTMAMAECELSSCTLYRGDNLLVLESLATANPCSFDFCYIDPPYNTKNKFIYNDSRMSNNHILWGSHAEWMTFMASRLIYVHELLKDTGVIAISIDDYEQPYLRVLLDKIFGESNFIACISVCRSKNGKGSKQGVSVNHEYIVIYGKSDKATMFGIEESDEDSYKKIDEHGRFKTDGLFRKKGDGSLRGDRPTMFYPLYYDMDGNVFTSNTTGNLKEVFPVDSKGVERRWLWGIEKASNEYWKLYASKSGVVYVKNYLTQGKRIKPKSFWIDNSYLTERATKQVKEIYGEKVFETPKPLDLIERIIECCTHKDASIIDFFAGTGTTAHAAYNLNTRDNGKRKVTLVEQEQIIQSSHIASKYGFNVIADITEHRLKWISENNPDFSFNTLNYSQ